MKQYTNPRMSAEIKDWPFGSSLRTTAFFDIEANSRGERAVRKMADPRTGRFCAPKTLTYSVKQRIVDGDDGRTYILCLTVYGSLSVMRGDMQFSEESVQPSDPRFEKLKAMFAATA